MYLWLHIQSAINMGFIVWMYRYYIVDILNILYSIMGLPLVDVVGVLVWCLLSLGGYWVV